MLTRQRRTTALFLALAVAPAWAREPVPGPLRLYVVADERTPRDDSRNRTDRMHSPVVENGLNPVAVVLSRTMPAGEDAPAANLVRELGKLAQKYRAANAAAVAVFLTLDKEYPEDDTRAEKAAAVKALADQLKSPSVLYGLAAGKADAANAPATAWKIDEGDDLTVVIYHRMQVVQQPNGQPARWAFAAGTLPTDEELQAILETFEREAKAGS